MGCAPLRSARPGSSQRWWPSTRQTRCDSQHHPWPMQCAFTGVSSSARQGGQREGRVAQGWVWGGTDAWSLPQWSPQQCAPGVGSPRRRSCVNAPPPRHPAAQVAIRPPSAARWRRACTAASCGLWPPPTPWSWAWTWATWTSPSTWCAGRLAWGVANNSLWGLHGWDGRKVNIGASRIDGWCVPMSPHKQPDPAAPPPACRVSPARSRRCGSRRAAQGGASSRACRWWCALTARWTSISSATQTSCSCAPSRRCRCACAHLRRRVRPRQGSPALNMGSWVTPAHRVPLPFSPQVDPANARLLRQHLACAAAELPLLPAEDGLLFGGAELLAAATRDLLAAGLLARHARAMGPGAAASVGADGGAGGSAADTALTASLHYSGPGRSPAPRISLRTIDPERYVIHDTAGGRVLEEVEANKVGGVCAAACKGGEGGKAGGAGGAAHGLVLQQGPGMRPAPTGCGGTSAVWCVPPRCQGPATCWFAPSRRCPRVARRSMSSTTVPFTCTRARPMCAPASTCTSASRACAPRALSTTPRCAGAAHAGNLLE